LSLLSDLNKKKNWMWVMNVDKMDQDRGWSSMMRALLKFNEIDTLMGLKVDFRIWEIC
jgi:hypothetical protein